MAYSMCMCVCIYIYIFPLPNATTCSYELSWFPSWLWRQCSRFVRLGHPWGATTLPRWCEWWYAWRLNTRRCLKPKSTNYPDHGHHGNLSLQGKIPMGNRTRNLMISSQRPWPLDHEAGQFHLYYDTYFSNLRDSPWLRSHGNLAARRKTVELRAR